MRYLSVFLFLLFCIFVSSEVSEKIQYTLNLIKQGEQKIETGKHDNILLLLGNTGSGKSTLAQLMAGDNDKLISKEVTKDSGEFIIEDSENKISNNSTLISQTIFPDLVFNNATNSAFYDCPGFSDTRNSSIDIASTFFIRKVISSAKSIKIVFVVNYSSVKEGVDRNDFLVLIKHAATFFKNFNKFGDSIALVVTKVDNLYVKKETDLVLVSDEKIIENIAQFLQKAKDSLKDFIKEENDIAKQETLKNAIELVDILLKQQNSKFEKIGIFRRPDEAGPVSKIQLLQNGKMKLQNLFDINIKYVSQNEQDFGYTISEESKADINLIVEQINVEISKYITEAADFLKINFLKLENEFTDFSVLKNSFDMAFDTVSEMIQNFNSLESPKQLSVILIETFHNKLQLQISDQLISNIVKYDNFIEFLQLVISKKLTLKPVLMAEAFENGIKYLSDSKVIYTFLVDFHIKLSDWSVQINPTAFNIEIFKNQMIEIEKQGVTVTGNHIKSFLDQIYYEDIKNGHAIAGFDSIANAEFDSGKLNILFEILELTIHHKLEIYCENNNILVAKGSFVKISSVLNTQICPERIQRIEIYGLRKIFFDQDLQQIGQNIKLLIASAIWEVIDIRQINLIGDSAGGYPEIKAANGLNGAGGAVEGANGGQGADGLPGIRAESGGAFFGISARNMNGHNLVVRSIGGNGGSGQNGGDGGNGENGKDVGWIKDPNVPAFIYGYKMIRTGGMGGKGGNGGHGGKGGYAGVGSELELIGISENPSSRVERNSGQAGPDGLGGLHGTGAMSGDQCTGLLLIRPPMNPVATGVECNKVKADDGSDGVVGGNTSPYPQADVVYIDKKLDFLNNLKNLVTVNLNNRITKTVLTDFLNAINSNENLNKIA